MKRTDLVDTWLSALRSGEYKQNAGALRKNDKFCCLGVLCDVSGLDKWTDRGLYQVYLTSAGHLSQSTAKALGVTLYEAQTLSSMNDDGASFIQIADAIEAMIDE